MIFWLQNLAMKQFFTFKTNLSKKYMIFFQTSSDFCNGEMRLRPKINQIF